MADTEVRTSTNRLIAALPDSERFAVLDEATEMPLQIGDVLAEAGEPFSHGYFPLSCVLSIVTVLEDGSMIEAATVGNEGLLGIPLILGAPSASNTRRVCQIKGDCLRIPADTLVRLGEELPVLRSVLLRYANALLVQVSQSAACNRRHSAEQRGAKWLLMTHDRVEGDRFDLTHEFLAQMIGVRRASVSEVQNHLRTLGLIDYRRGEIEIVDRAGLEAASCGCYAQIRQEYDTYLSTVQGSTAALGRARV